jgi:hypothetical protein
VNIYLLTESNVIELVFDSSVEVFTYSVGSHTTLRDNNALLIPIVKCPKLAQGKVLDDGLLDILFCTVLDDRLAVRISPAKPSRYPSRRTP